ncbi:hypothetical protein QBE52_14680 [Clostridiaceae bacterium 35-E11]
MKNTIKNYHITTDRDEVILLLTIGIKSMNMEKHSWMLGRPLIII